MKKKKKKKSVSHKHKKKLEVAVKCKYSKLVATDHLKPFPRNPNRHTDAQIQRLADIIEYQGWRRPIRVSLASNCITAGHGALSAAKLKGWKEAPVDYQEYESSEQEYADVVADNSLHEWNDVGIDLALVNENVPNLGPDFDIDFLGIEDFEIEPADKYADRDADAIPENVKPICKTSDLWQLGEHRLLCGDCTVKENIDPLMQGEKADMVFTDPPYGIDLDTDWSKTGRKNSFEWRDGSGKPTGITEKFGKKHNKIIMDDKKFDPTFLLDFFYAIKEIFLWGAEYYHNHIPLDGSWVVWDKTTNESADKTFGSNFELCWSKQRHKREIARIRSGIFGSKDYGFKDPKRVHPTQKPVALAEWFFERWGKNTNLVWDGYLGSGSTLIACEKTNRKCYGMEIDPHYCDVIIKRWEDFTGKKAKKIG